LSLVPKIYRTPYSCDDLLPFATGIESLSKTLFVWLHQQIPEKLKLTTPSGNTTRSKFTSDAVSALSCIRPKTYRVEASVNDGKFMRRDVQYSGSAAENLSAATVVEAYAKKFYRSHRKRKFIAWASGIGCRADGKFIALA
jgi:hypothetical protein